MTATASSDDTQICLGCQEKVVFITEAFGCVCTECGTVVEEADLRFDNGTHFFRTKSSFDSNKNLQYEYGRLQQEARKANSALHLDEYRQSRPEIDAVVGAVLARYGRASLLREVQDLVIQVQKIHDHHLKTKSENSRLVLDEGLPIDTDDADIAKKAVHLNGEQATLKLAIAATFSTLKKHIETVTLEEVCSIASIAPLNQVADSLRYMENLIGKTCLLSISRDDPRIFITAQVTFLAEQIKLKPRSRIEILLPVQHDESMLEFEEQHFVREAKIESASFSKLASELCDLCSFHGLNNRSTKTSVRKDLVLCAWAILILAMEAASGQVCNQGKMAKVAVAFKAWQEGGNTNAKVEERALLQLNSARRATEEVVKKRCVEISRMLTMYLDQLPWLSDEKPSVKEKKARKSKTRGKVAEVKQDLSSIKPFPRRVVARYLTDVIKLRHFIEMKLSRQESEWNAMQWSRFSSTEDQFHRIRASIDGQRRIKEEEWQYLSEKKASPVIMSSQTGFLEAVNDLLSREGNLADEIDQSSKLANCIGSTLLQYDSLRDMVDEVVDSLLFEDGEMESYLRPSEEVDLIRALRTDKGDWDPLTSFSSGIKRARSEEEELEMGKTIFVGGKRTKALTEEEEARILSLL